MPRALLAAAVSATLLAAGCGGGDDAPDPRPSADRPAPPTDTTPPPAAGADPAPGPDESRGGLPDGVPTSPSGPAPAGAEPVIRAWLAAVRDARFDRAGALFARGARVQNGGPVLRLLTGRQAEAWNAMLPCGARLTGLRGAKGYAIATFELVDRRGAECGSGRGAPAYGAIRVQDGRITEWYRLADPIAPSGDPNAPFV